LTRVLLFDWSSGGHHSIYLRRFAESLAPRCDVVVAASDATLKDIADLDLPYYSAGPSRPQWDYGRSVLLQRRGIAAQERSHLLRAVQSLAPAHVIHMHADPMLENLTLGRLLPSRLSLFLFNPRQHYPGAFGTRRTLAARLKARLYDSMVSRWRRRKDAHAIITLDPYAAERWSHGRGAKAVWIPEPPITEPLPPLAGAERSGSVLYGALRPEKGLDVLSYAVQAAPLSEKLVIGGSVAPGFEGAVDATVAQMRAGGTKVDLRAWPHTEAEGLQLLGSGKVALMPYVGYSGMSRTLVESCAMGTPVIVHDAGLLGHLVRSSGIGMAVNCREPTQLRRAIEQMTAESPPVRPDTAVLADFSSRYSKAAFDHALRVLL
jgi:glycosyltransferase involved in cell wall biosynthesis